jgi:hypothetical protein
MTTLKASIPKMAFKLVERRDMSATTYLWQKNYDAAVLEMDSAQLPNRVKDALKSIEERMEKGIVYGGDEHQAIVEARKSLGALKSTRR